MGQKGFMRVIASFLLCALLFISTCFAAAPTPEEFLVLCANGTPDQVQAAINAGADVNAPGAFEYGNTTALVVAIRKNEKYAFPVTKILLDAGANPNIVYNRHNMTALMFAAVEGKEPAFLEMLLNAGANISARSSDGNTVLHWAVYHLRNSQNRAQNIALLISRGADINAQNNYGATVLFAPFYWEKTLFIKTLLQHGADPNIRSIDGETALLSLAKFREPLLFDNVLASIEVYARYGGDVNAYDNSTMYTSYDGDVYVYDNSSKTAYDYFSYSSYYGGNRTFMKALKKLGLKKYSDL